MFDFDNFDIISNGFKSGFYGHFEKKEKSRTLLTVPDSKLDFTSIRTL